MTDDRCACGHEERDHDLDYDVCQICQCDHYRLADHDEGLWDRDDR